MANDSVNKIIGNVTSRHRPGGRACEALPPPSCPLVARPPRWQAPNQHMPLADDTLKVASPQSGAWDAGIAELGQRAGIFKKHGLDLDILYTRPVRN